MQNLKVELLELLRKNDLLRSSLLLGKIAEVKFSEDTYIEKVMGLAAHVWCKGAGTKHDAILKAESINSVLFAEFGLQSKAENYKKVIDNPSRFYLHELLDTKSGSPLTVTILYLILADQIGLSCDCYSLPTQYLLKVDDGLCEFYISPFDRGKFYSRDEFHRNSRDHCPGQPFCQTISSNR